MTAKTHHAAQSVGGKDAREGFAQESGTNRAMQKEGRASVCESVRADKKRKREGENL